MKKYLISKVWVLALILCSLLTIKFFDEVKSLQAEPLTSWQVTAAADCAVVLTGGAGRIREGFDLLSNRQVKKLIVSGVNVNAQLREIMPAWPFYGNLSENQVILERHSETTYGNAVQSLSIVEALKCRDVVLVTSRLHMYRAYRTFRAIYPDTIQLFKQPVVSGKLIPTWDETAMEGIKSLFYSFWTY